MKKRIELERLALQAIVGIAFTILILAGIYPIFGFTLDASLGNILSACVGSLFTYLRITPVAKEVEEPVQKKDEVKEEGQ